MGLFEGKKGLILGVANDRSIAWSVAKVILDEGGICGFSHLPDREDDDKKKNRRRVAKCVEGYERAQFLEPMNVQKDEDIAAFMRKAGEEFGKIDFLLHSIAFADRNDLMRDTVETRRSGFALAMDVSVYSLLAVVNAAKDLFHPGAAVATMTYFGGGEVRPWLQRDGNLQGRPRRHDAILGLRSWPSRRSSQRAQRRPRENVGRLGRRGGRHDQAV